jgi:hypothetical protein
MTFTIMTLSITTYSIIAFSTMTFSIMTFSITTLSRMAEFCYADSNACWELQVTLLCWMLLCWVSWRRHRVNTVKLFYGYNEFRKVISYSSNTVSYFSPSLIFAGKAVSWVQGWVRLLNDYKKWPRAAQSNTRSWFLWDEINFKNLIYTSFNE